MLLEIILRLTQLASYIRFGLLYVRKKGYIRARAHSSDRYRSRHGLIARRAFTLGASASHSAAAAALPRSSGWSRAAAHETIGGEGPAGSLLGHSPALLFGSCRSEAAVPDAWFLEGLAPPGLAPAPSFSCFQAEAEAY